LENAIMALRRVKLLKSLLVGAIVGFAVAASYTTSLVAERQDALRQVWRYNTAWLASQAVVEFMRFEQRVSAFEIQGSGVGQDEVQLRLDILFNRLKLLKEGDFEEFVRHDPERRQIIDHLGAVLAAVQPLIDSPDRPGAAQTALKMLSPLDGKLVSLASAANRSGGDRVAEDQHELIRLHWFFTSLVVGLILFGVALVGMLARHNRDIERAHDALRTLAGSLQRTSSDLETANRHFGAALNNMSQGLCMVDGRQRLIVCNQRFLDMFGLAADAVEPGTLAHDLFDHIVAGGQYAESVLRSVQDGQQQLVREGRAAGFFQEGEDGRSIAVAHESMADGGWVATYEDITERRRAEAQTPIWRTMIR
jgi:PAS domain S-box-containing protein